MEKTHAVLYDLAVTIGSEVHLQPLLTKTLQRLLYHTSFPCGLIFLNEKKEGTGFEKVDVRLEAAIGDYELVNNIGKVIAVPSLLLKGDTAMIDDISLLEALPCRKGYYSFCMCLFIDEHGVILLLSPSSPKTSLPLLMFRPIMSNLAKSIVLCRNYEEHESLLLAERNRAMADLERISRRNKLILESAGEGIYGVDIDGKATFVNPAAEKILGYKAEELFGRVMHEVIHGKKEDGSPYPLDECPLQKAIKEGKKGAQEAIFWRKDGTSFPVEDVSNPIMEGGAIIGAVVVFRDITERKKAEELIRMQSLELEKRVAERTAQLEAANAELEAFSYSVSHDLRAPLRAIEGFSDIIREDHSGEMNEEVLRLFNVIRDNAAKMGKLINDILEFSRLGRKELMHEETDMDGLVRQIIEDMKQANPGRNIRFTLGDIPAAHGDRAMLSRVFSNLLSNAFKFTRPKETAVVEIGGMSEGNENIYYVRDNGVGFDMSFADKLFVVFQRLHGQDEFEGTGVGLANVKRIIQRHGGRVWGEGKVGEGAVFYFTLPKKQ